MWWPALGGLVVGLGGLIEPRALGVGYDVIADLLSGHIVVSAVLLILIVKAAIWLVASPPEPPAACLRPFLSWEGDGLAGGIGTARRTGLLGAPRHGGDARRYDARTLTGALFAVELTGDTHALPALLAASAAAYAVTVLLLKRSILTEKIARRGQHITREYGIDPHQFTRCPT